MIKSNSTLTDDESHPYVCKFRGCNDEKFHQLLQNQQIYIPTIEKLNDPLEIILTEGYQWTENTTQTKPNGMEAYLRKVGAYCVSIYKPKWHSSNFLPMWASYAENHTGVCMVLKRKLLTDNRYKWVNMEYISHPHNHHQKSLPHSISQPIFTADLYKNSQIKLSRKFDYWQHEKEMRLIAEPGCTGYQKMRDFFDLHALIFGFNAHRDGITKILSQLSDEEINRLMATRDGGVYQTEKPTSAYMHCSLRDIRLNS